MTKREAVIVSAYTGYLLGRFGDLHAYIEEKCGSPVWTHEMATREFQEKLTRLSKSDFVALTVED